jgi:hypothetical protein
MLFKKMETHFVSNFSEPLAIDEIITINATDPQKPKKLLLLLLLNAFGL